MTAATERAKLDRMLRTKTGQTCILRRLLGTQLAHVDVEVRARVFEYDPTKIVEGSSLQIGASKVIMSATEIIAAQWPGAVPSGQATPGDARVPRKGDQLIVAGKARAVLTAEPVYIGDELVRINMTID